MLEIYCSGTPYDIGLKHGSEAKVEVSRTITFYRGMFEKTAKLDWPDVHKLALEFEPILRRKWPAYLEEMNGVADGAGVTLADIIAINVRTEIAFGLFSDGCTSMSWKSSQGSILAQNWDWMEDQKQNLIVATIEQQGKPTIKMVTEAGLLGKIGLNSAGVGVCFNAIRAKGMDPTRIPSHLGLRLVLESKTREEAVQALEKYGVAASCHMLVADATGGVGLEWSSIELQKVQMNASQQVFHSNHYLIEHPGVHDTNWIGNDSEYRVARIEELCKQLGSEPTFDSISDIFKDEGNYPAAICRAQLDGVQSATLFNIVMDLTRKVATVKLGRPVAPEQVIELSF